MEIDQFNVEVVPDHMLLILNIDRPGVIGMVGKVLGDNQINIVRMQCALEKRGGNALIIIGSDATFPEAVLEAIKSSKDILSVKVAALSTSRLPRSQPWSPLLEASSSPPLVRRSRALARPRGHGDDSSSCGEAGPPP